MPFVKITDFGLTKEKDQGLGTERTSRASVRSELRAENRGLSVECRELRAAKLEAQRLGTSEPMQSLERSCPIALRRGCTRS